MQNILFFFCFVCNEEKKAKLDEDETQYSQLISHLDKVRKESFFCSNLFLFGSDYLRPTSRVMQSQHNDRRGTCQAWYVADKQSLTIMLIKS